MSQGQQSFNPADDSAEVFVPQVKEVFFSIVRPYLYNINDFINKRSGSARPNFGTYFDKGAYLSQYDDITDDHSAFARALVES